MICRAVLMLSVVFCVLGAPIGYAAQVTGLTAFEAGTPARASEVNGNFTAVKTAVDASHVDILALQETISSLQDAVTALQTTAAAQASELAAHAAELGAQASEITALESSLNTADSTIAALQAANTTLTSQLDAIQDSAIMALNGYLTVEASGTPNARLSGINLQLVNGAGSTATANGTGNLIIGYDEPRTMGGPICSIGSNSAGVVINTPGLCAGNGGVWATSHKSGSHYLIVGEGHSYSRWGGIVAGFNNAANGNRASVSGGQYNIASGLSASVSGGRHNVASGGVASVTGGDANTASGPFSSVSGGSGGTAPDDLDWVAGGLFQDN